MERKKLNNILFAAEVTVFCLAAILFVVLGMSGSVSTATANVIYIVFISVAFGYLFALEFLFPKFDNAVHFKAFEKYYISTGKERPEGYRRKGLLLVLLLWAAYLSFVAFLKFYGLLNWYVFLVGAAFVFSLNSLFSRKVCLLSLLVLHNKNHCCKNCGINSWDYAIFSSALLFAPELSLAATILNWTVVLFSLVMLVIWEVNYRKHPYRFYPETNKALHCHTCLKQCKRGY